VFSLVPQSKNVSPSAKKIGTPVLPTHKDEVRHRRGRHGKLPSPCTSNISGRVRLPNNPRLQKVSSRKLAGNQHPLGWRHSGTPGIHHLRRIICYDCHNNGCQSNTLENPTRPWVAPANKDSTVAQISDVHHI
jgi:hypothetical protein